MALINVPNIQNLDAATPELWNSRFGTIANEINGNLDSANLKDLGVTASKLASSAVTTGKVADGAITPVKISNPYKFHAYRAGGTQSIGSMAILQYNAEVFDTNNNYDTSTYTYTVPVDGFYMLGCVVQSSGVGGLTAIYIDIYKNGSQFKEAGTPQVGAVPGGAQIHVMSQLTAGDTIDFRAAGTTTFSSVTGALYNYSYGFLVTPT